jgi:hypothetical protein
MKHDHFLDAGSFGLSCAPLEFGEVRVANRAINEAPELQMDEALWIGEVTAPVSYSTTSIRCCLWPPRSRLSSP